MDCSNSKPNPQEESLLSKKDLTDLIRFRSGHHLALRRWFHQTRKCEDDPVRDWDQPETIPDPTARKPSDWDDGMDGEWEPRRMTNPYYKGDWKPKQIDNPDYKGEWLHPEIDNPEYVHDPTMYKFDNIAVLALDLWQMRSGTIFDNFLITDDIAEAEKFGEQTWGVTTEPEKKMRTEQLMQEQEQEQEEVDGEQHEIDHEEEDDEEEDDERVTEEHVKNTEL